METETLTSTSPPLCKHWARSKACLYHNNGGKCKFSHPADYEVPLVSTIKHQNQRHRSTGGRLQTRNDTRVAKLRSFIATFLDISKCKILDVAGGKGEMAFQLLNLSNAATCHVIDPRPLSLARYQKRLRRGFYHRSASVLGSLQDIVRQQDEPERPVGHLRCFFREELWQDDDEEENLEEFETQSGSNNRSNKQQEFENNCQNSQKWTWPPVGDDNEHANSSNCGCGCVHDDRDEKDYSIVHTTSTAVTTTTTTTATNGLAMPQSENLTFDHASSTVKDANLIIGMHPDQAVDAIVDAALHLNISFFVVPCCTYSREFPHRRLKYIPPPQKDDSDGDAGNVNVNNDKCVTTYADLLTYLQEKSPDIQRHILPFEGKNVCLYRIV